MIWRSALEAALIVRPPALSNRILVPTGNSKRNDARTARGSNQAHTLKLGRRDNTAGDNIKDGDFGEVPHMRYYARGFAIGREPKVRAAGSRLAVTKTRLDGTLFQS